jgi:hypothetical protein
MRSTFQELAGMDGVTLVVACEVLDGKISKGSPRHPSLPGLTRRSMKHQKNGAILHDGLPGQARQ